MKLSIRLSALALAVVLLATSRAREAGAAPPPPEAEEGPCQVYCEAMHALCRLFGGGYLCTDMRDGCRFGCNIKVT